MQTISATRYSGITLTSKDQSIELDSYHMTEQIFSDVLTDMAPNADPIDIEVASQMLADDELLNDFEDGGEYAEALGVTVTAAEVAPVDHRVSVGMDFTSGTHGD